MHQPPWSFGFDSQTRGARENRAPPCVKVPGSSSLVAHVLHLPPPTHANLFVIGTVVINTHPVRRPERNAGGAVRDVRVVTLEREGPGPGGRVKGVVGPGIRKKHEFRSYHMV